MYHTRKPKKNEKRKKEKKECQKPDFILSNHLPKD